MLGGSTSPNNTTGPTQGGEVYRLAAKALKGQRPRLATGFNAGTGTYDYITSFDPAKQNYYYSFRDEKGQLDHSVEESFGMIEASALPVISRLAREDFQPDWIERGWLAAFMAMHEMRVPWM